MSEPEDLHEPNPEDLELQRAVRDLLRSDPVEIDPTRREAAIAAALEAAVSLEGPEEVAAERTAAQVAAHRSPAARHRRRPPGALQPILVAAAAVAVVAGGVAAFGQLGSDSQVDSAAEAESAHADSSTMSGASNEAGTDAAAGDDGSAAAPTTTVAAPSSAQRSAPDLGDFADVDALLETAATTLGPASSFDGSEQEGLASAEAELRDRAAAAGLPCAQQAGDRAAMPVALARVQAESVVVARTDTGTFLVLDAASCGELARR
jgi:negative regulator of sigma E activity